MAYIVGVYIGDAFASEKNYQYRIRLKVVGRDFAQNFERALRAIGANPRTSFERNRDRADRWRVEVTNKELFMFLKDLKEGLFEVARGYPREFLRGFFDSEGSVYVNIKNPRRATVVADNYDRDILEFCKSQLEIPRIHSTIYLSKRKGTKVLIRGQEYQYNNDLYRISIHRRASVARFAQELGFSISRKQEKLRTFLKAYYHNTTEKRLPPKVYSGGRI